MFCSRLTSPTIILLNTTFFHSTTINFAVGNVMKKIISGAKKKKRMYIEEAIVPTSNTFTKDLFKKQNPENKRRLAVLNKLFMTHITDLMTSGDYATEFAGYGLEISKVKVTPDYHGINVYWLARDGIRDEELDKLLQSKSAPLRHELTQLHLIGIVPRIKFIKDKEYAGVAEVESRLAYADFGEDHEYSQVNHKYRSHLELTKSLDPDLKSKILALEECTKPADFEDIPPMPQNVLGLNHAEIMERVKRGMKKSQALHRCDTTSTQSNTQRPSLNLNPIEFNSARTQREAFQQFLAERQILRNKARKASKNYRPEWDYIEEESEILNQQRLDAIKFNEMDDADYVEEDFEEEQDKRL